MYYDCCDIELYSTTAVFGPTVESILRYHHAMPQVVAVEFTRSPNMLFDCLVYGSALDHHRASMLAVGRPCIFGDEGAKLFVSPDDVHDVLFYISNTGVTFDNCEPLYWDDLRARHMIVSIALEADVLAAIAASPGSGLNGGKGKDHVNIKRRMIIDIPSAAWHSQVDDGFELSFSF
jgi:hypothetical protein